MNLLYLYYTRRLPEGQRGSYPQLMLIIMKKKEYQELIDKTAENAKAFNNSWDKLKGSAEEIEKIKLDVVGNEGNIGLLERIKSSVEDLEEKSENVRSAYDEICGDDKETESIKTKLKNILSNFEEDKKKIGEFEARVFSKQSKNDTGEIEGVEGLEQKLESLYKEQQSKYIELYKKIEQELHSGTTSANLSKTFADKVNEYFWSGIIWSLLFMSLLGTSVWYGYLTISIESQHVQSLGDVWRILALRIPLIAFVIWFAIFLGNRRAESKKLEESYKHKEVIARSFVGYKKTLEELGDEDKTLLKQHMNNLLVAMSADSSGFLTSEGEKHPIMEAFVAFFKPQGSRNGKGHD